MKIIIKDSKSEVVIAPELGASILAYDYITNDNRFSIFPNRLGAVDVTSTACFPLVPFSNRIREGKFFWQGEQIQLPLNQLPERHTNHGHGWQVAWDVDEQTESSLTLSYVHTANEWPFSYKSIYRFELQNGELLQTLILKNLSPNEMPAGLGLHPYFSRTDQVTLKADVKQMWQVDNESMPVTVIDAPKCLQSAQGMVVNDHQLDNTFIDFPAKAKVCWPEWQMCAEVSASTNCKFMVVYSPEKQDFFCVEPVTHAPNAINKHQRGIENTGFSSLKSQQEMTVWMRVSPKPV